MKRVFIILLCLLCIPALSQDKAFKAGLKKGKGANGYYHADLSKMAFTEDELVNYAKKNGYLIRNLKEGQVMQFGGYYTAVVSLDFIPVGEASKDDRSLTRADSSPIIKDANDKLMELANQMLKVFREQPGKDIVTYKENVWHQPHSAETVIKAGAAVDYFFIKYITGGLGNDYTHYFFVHRDYLEKVLRQKVFGGKSGNFAAVGKGLYYQYSGAMINNPFVWRDQIKWSGNLSRQGNLDGTGFGYDLIVEPKKIRIECIEGTFDNGKPIVENRFLITDGFSLIEKDPASPAIVSIRPLQKGLILNQTAFADKDWGIETILNQNYETKIENASLLTSDLFQSPGNNKTSFVSQDGNGGLIFRSHYDILDIDLEYIVDENGNLTGFTDKTRNAAYGRLDEMIAAYDTYLSKVLNPSDIIHPESTLLKRFNYKLTDFNYDRFRAFTDTKGLKMIWDGYQKQSAEKINRLFFAKDTYLLFRETYVLEEENKKRLSETALDWAANSSITKPSGFFGETYITMDEFGRGYDTYSRPWKNSQGIIERMKASPVKPSNFGATEKALMAEFGKSVSWWSTVYDRANAVLLSRINNDIKEKKDYARKMCEKCLIVGKESTFPKGYVEAYHGIFTSRPAQSDEDGVLVLQNGEQCTWKFYYYESGTIIDVSGDYSGKFKSVGEMVEKILEDCNRTWGSRM